LTADKTAGLTVGIDGMFSNGKKQQESTAENATELTAGEDSTVKHRVLTARTGQQDY
jgi:hypothetical protein